MPGNLDYWYGEAFSGGIYSELPAQAVSYNKKRTKEFRKSVMDALENIGLKQMEENLQFRDLYRMVEGKLSYSELSEVIPQLQELEEGLNEAHIPTFLKHYDILGIIIRALRGEYLSHSDKFSITQTDEIASNEYIRDKTEFLQKYVADKWNKELELRLISRGLYNPDDMSFGSEEEKQQYINQIEQVKYELTPPEIQEHMSSNWVTVAVKWANSTMDSDYERFRMSELDLQNLTDYLLTGRCFRHFRVGYDSYEPEVWSPLNTFFSHNLNVKYPQEGDYIGRIHYYSPSQIIAKYGHLLTKEEKEHILNHRGYIGGGSHDGGKPLHYSKIVKGDFGETQILPHKDYHDYNFMLGVQETFGIPMGKKVIYHKDGTEETVESYLPRRFRGGYSGMFGSKAKSLSDSTSLRNDLIQVTEAYFVSYKKFGMITFEDIETGRLTQETVSEEILPEFLKERNIKTLRNVTVTEAEENPIPNTIVWDYVPEVWSGVKINNINTGLEESLYLKVEPLDYQIKGNSKLYQIELPVAGIIGKGVAPLILPYQIGHNIAMNQMYNLLEKEIGLFFLFDMAYLPSSYKNWSEDTDDILANMVQNIKQTGLMPIDTSVANLKGVAGGMMQFMPQNLSYSAQIADRMQLAEFYKNKAFEQIGVNPQRLGAPTKHETAEGVRQSVSASYSQTEPFFEEFSDFKRRAWDMHIVVAQYCQRENKDISVFYTKSDATNAWLQFSDPDFHLRRFSIITTSNSNERKNLETFKQFALNNNTIGSDLMSVAEIISSDTFTEAIEIARKARIYNERQQQQQHENAMEQQQQLDELERNRFKETWELNEVSKEADRENRIQVEHIKALGRGVDKNTDREGLNEINRQAEIALENRRIDYEEKMSERKQVVDEVTRREESEMKHKEFELKVRELNEKIERRKADERIALMNKN